VFVYLVLSQQVVVVVLVSVCFFLLLLLLLVEVAAVVVVVVRIVYGFFVYMSFWRLEAEHNGASSFLYILTGVVISYTLEVQSIDCSVHKRRSKKVTNHKSKQYTFRLTK